MIQVHCHQQLQGRESATKKDDMERDAKRHRTTTTVFEDVTTVSCTTTSRQITVTTTIGHIGKRDVAATITSTIDVEPEPYSYNYLSSFVSGAERNASIASSVYSACSCLHLTPKTVSSRSTVQTVKFSATYRQRLQADLPSDQNHHRSNRRDRTRNYDHRRYVNVDRDGYSPPPTKCSLLQCLISLSK